MERKTKLNAEQGKQDLQITRDFDLPLELLFRAFSEPEIIEQWMGTNVLKHESEKHGGYAFETRDKDGNPVFRANGVYHEFIPNEKVTRTFEMENAGFGVQLEFFDFEKISEESSRLVMQIVYRSAALRDQNLKLPFAQGINMAHDRLEKVLQQLK
ncbi:SRPBCC family protein [Chitinophaga lutea]